ncbi:phosphoinositide phospholipase c 2 [Phtheirospermum japonicum]|uniref:Phosphoinositide phospholipase C n=1 Tax=Phtheirospermum japonicum TaxID=374723 RepID=A0A830C440_9LAMI|nr:phosphoinositide phospholipase c 2 [Phtheirospermum japonicum]
MSKQTYSICFCFKRKFKLKEDEMPADIKSTFENYSENGLMNVEHLHKFLKEVQGDDKLTGAEAEAVMESILNEHKHLHIFQRKSLSIKEFFRYLLSEINSPLPYPPKVNHDMSAPLSHYFIYTGHNSYLTGNQISSDSSDVPIIEALRRGVRVIELDMWPNSTKDDINILHGGTLTTPVKLIKCLEAIRANAFVASEYPVILTLEDHLTPDLQAKVAEMVNQTFGDKLFCSTSSEECLQDFPSPDSLKGRVIISTKPPKEYLETKSSNKESDTSVKVIKSLEEITWGKEISDLGAKFSNNDEGAYDQDDDQNIIINDSLQQPVNAAPTEYKHLIAIRNEKMKGGIKAWLRVDSKKAHRVSLNEEKLEKAVLTHGTEIVRFNQTNLMRVYPKATRIDSSNFNPLIGWIHGAQMVAFNMQGHGRSLWLMQGMFRANGGCGYVKKPDIILNLGPNNEVFDPKRQLPVKRILKVKIYMGEGWNMDFHRTHFDLYSPPDFYVKIGIAGVPLDSSMAKTKVIEDNWTPVWNEEFEFPLSIPELALLRIEVHEFDMSDKDDFGGQTCLPVSELKTGIRAIPLHDHKGEKYKSVKLLARFDFV